MPEVENVTMYTQDDNKLYTSSSDIPEHPLWWAWLWGSEPSMRTKGSRVFHQALVQLHEEPLVVVVLHLSAT